MSWECWIFPVLMLKTLDSVEYWLPFCLWKADWNGAELLYCEYLSMKKSSVGTNRLEDYNKLPFVCRFCSLHWKTQFKKQHNSENQRETKKPTILLLSNYVSTANRLEIVLFKKSYSQPCCCTQHVNFCLEKWFVKTKKRRIAHRDQINVT